MKLINTDGLALIGPGSEWFWTAISGVILAVTFLAIYRQLSGQRAASAFEQTHALQERWDSERMVTIQWRLAVALKNGSKADVEALSGQVILFFENLAELDAKGYVERGLVADVFAVDAIRWWTLVSPSIFAAREEYGPGLGHGFERLVAESRTVLAARGVTAIKEDPASTAARLDWMLPRLEARLRLEREIRSSEA